MREIQLNQWNITKLQFMEWIAETEAFKGLGISGWTLRKRMEEYPADFYRIL